MLTIYGVHRSRATRVIWTCYENDIPFRQVPVIQAGRAAGPAMRPGMMTTDAPEFLAINPTGKIPCVVHDGLVLSESHAIVLHLARNYGGPAAPADLREEALALQWCFFAATEIEPWSVQVLYHRVTRPEAERDPAVAAAALHALSRPLAALEAHLTQNAFLLGARFTVADIACVDTLRYLDGAPEALAPHPRLRAWATGCRERPAFRRMWEEREREPA